MGEVDKEKGREGEGRGGGGREDRRRRRTGGGKVWEGKGWQRINKGKRIQQYRANVYIELS